jgi:hypothetical protein
MAKSTTKSSKGSKGKVKKTKCPITVDQFEESARPISISINGTEFAADPKVFKKGSFGFYLNGKVTISIKVDGEVIPVKYQVGMNVTAVGSKPEDNGSDEE